MVIFGLTTDEVSAEAGPERSAALGDRRLAARSRKRWSRSPPACSRPDDPNRYRDLIGGLYDHDWFMVARDFDAYAAAQAKVDELWQQTAQMVFDGDPEHGPHGLVLLGPDDPAVCRGDLGRSETSKGLSWRDQGELAGRDGRTSRRSSRGNSANPFGILGLHEVDGKWVARTFIPHAETVVAFASDGTELGHLIPRHPAGFFEGLVPITERCPIRYRAKNAGGEWDVNDPYCFGPVLGPMDDYYIGEGSHLRLFDKLGAHAMEFEGVDGTHFAVWAPNARRVSVVGPFNEWDGRRHPMRLRLETGIWEVFIPVLGPGTLYKFEIVGQDGKLHAAQGRSLRAAVGNAAARRPRWCRSDAVHLDRRRVHRGARASTTGGGRRCRSTRCISAPGAGGRMAAS